ncbi:ImmA/IrrE family metallo-endopeptidase [Aerolutibacter ruishenii]|uniref:Uncharacterized protein DUF955 n=1 Tax=Aerolutibacter ruishenii TaxID=686800 RepID=A0A562LFJ0_9GAMM|nr:ImmA/IrrE family metallo-endopeptidase [Lysobacter ruishenii]TWI06377.1 uncharacterized protein DUF955 [Lysobacter ruishenii]
MNEFEAELKARAFVKRISPQSAPVPLEPYLADVGAKFLVDDAMAPDEAGYSMPIGAGFLVAVNGRDRLERQRFTACHEIGHIVLGLPSEHGPAQLQRHPNEICCDVFAAELLLPVHLFRPAIAERPATFQALEELREVFQASLHCLGSRYAALSREICAFVVARAGVIQHCFRSPPMRSSGLAVRRGMRFPAKSKAAKLRGDVEVQELVEHQADAWLEGELNGVVIEDAIHDVERDTSLILLTCDCEVISNALSRSSDPRASYERDGLDELSGTLSWNRRR